MGKTRRGNYIFYSWIGDHGHHVHVYKDSRPILKWDLTENKVMDGGKMTKKLRKIIEALQKEGQI